MCESLTPAAIEARRTYQRKRYALRKANGSARKPAPDALSEAYREYKRRYYAQNPEIHKAAQFRYWERKSRKDVDINE